MDREKKNIYVHIAVMDELTQVKWDLYQNLFDHFTLIEKIESHSGDVMDYKMAEILLDFYLSICKFHGINLEGDNDED